MQSIFLPIKNELKSSTIIFLALMGSNISNFGRDEGNWRIFKYNKIFKREQKLVECNEHCP